MDRPELSTLLRGCFEDSVPSGSSDTYAEDDLSSTLPPGTVRCANAEEASQRLLSAFQMTPAYRSLNFHLCVFANYIAKESWERRGIKSSHSSLLNSLGEWLAAALEWAAYAWPYSLYTPGANAHMTPPLPPILRHYAAASSGQVLAEHLGSNNLTPPPPIMYGVPDSPRLAQISPPCLPRYFGPAYSRVVPMRCVAAAASPLLSSTSLAVPYHVQVPLSLCSRSGPRSWMAQKLAGFPHPSVATAMALVRCHHLASVAQGTPLLHLPSSVDSKSHCGVEDGLLCHLLNKGEQLGPWRWRTNVLELSKGLSPTILNLLDEEGEDAFAGGNCTGEVDLKMARENSPSSPSIHHQKQRVHEISSDAPPSFLQPKGSLYSLKSPQPLNKDSSSYYLGNSSLPFPNPLPNDEGIQSNPFVLTPPSSRPTSIRGDTLTSPLPQSYPPSTSKSVTPPTPKVMDGGNGNGFSASRLTPPGSSIYIPQASSQMSLAWGVLNGSFTVNSKNNSEDSDTLPDSFFAPTSTPSSSSSPHFLLLPRMGLPHQATDLLREHLETILFTCPASPPLSQLVFRKRERELEWTETVWNHAAAITAGEMGRGGSSGRFSESSRDTVKNRQAPFSESNRSSSSLLFGMTSLPCLKNPHLTSLAGAHLGRACCLRAAPTPALKIKELVAASEVLDRGLRVFGSDQGYCEGQDREAPAASTVATGADDLLPAMIFTLLAAAPPGILDALDALENVGKAFGAGGGGQGSYVVTNWRIAAEFLRREGAKVEEGGACSTVDAKNSAFAPDGPKAALV